MSEVRFFGGSRRKFWVYSGLVFISGLIIGMLFGVFGLRYIFFRFPPQPSEMVARTTKRIQDDFNLDVDARKLIENEITAIFQDVTQAIDATQEIIEQKIKTHAERIAEVFPAGETRQRWLREYKKYFPKRRPPPGSPPPPPSPGGMPRRD